MANCDDGEDDARDAVVETVEAADRTGRLRSNLDAVRSHRVEDDFSSHWSYAREDFERKLRGKRRKVTVKFVELADTIPVQGPESEVLGIWSPTTSSRCWTGGTGRSWLSPATGMGSVADCVINFLLDDHEFCDHGPV